MHETILGDAWRAKPPLQRAIHQCHADFDVCTDRCRDLLRTLPYLGPLEDWIPHNDRPISRQHLAGAAAGHDRTDRGVSGALCDTLAQE